MSDAAVATTVTGLVTITTMIMGFLTLWIKLKYGIKKVEEATEKAHTVEQKIDHNTVITEAATSAAVQNAVIAAETAVEARVATETLTRTLDKKLNGGLDLAIDAAIKPVRDALMDHIIQDETDMKEIRDSLNSLLRRIK